MKRNPLHIALSLLLFFSMGAFAASGEEDLKNSIRALEITAGKTPDVAVGTDKDINGDTRVGLAEAIYMIQQAGGVFVFSPGVENYKEDLLLSALEVDVAAGKRKEIVVFDTPRVGNDDAAFNRSDLLFEAVSGAEYVSIEHVTETRTIKGKEQSFAIYYINGVREGVSEIQVSYPGYKGQKTLIAVNVTGSGTGPAITSRLPLTKYDTVYFTEDKTEYSFPVSATGAAPVKATLHGKTTTAQNGIITVTLRDGYNPLVLQATNASGTTTMVHNIRAKKFAYVISNRTRLGSDAFFEGDKIAIGFSGLVTPIPKVSRIYNPADVHTVYKTTLPRYSTICGTASQYDLGSDNRMEIELTGAGEFTFTGGHIHENWFGNAMYAETPVGTAPPVGDAGQTDHRFSHLPDIHITVRSNPEYNPDIIAASIRNTEEIWPGDEVVVTIPGLDIQTIDKEHPLDPVDGWWIATLIDAYTLYSSDIPGLSTVRSKSANENPELKNLKTITFTVPENTTPGTYHLRGAYSWVKHGPDWWTRETDYFKGHIQDITFVVHKPVPGQVHGAVSISNPSLKKKLSVALGKGAGYTGSITSKELKTLHGSLDFSGADLTDADLAVLPYLVGVTEINLSNNPKLTSSSLTKDNFNWSKEKHLDFSGCTGITRIPDFAFKGCATLTQIKLPETITAMGVSAFEDCTGLTALSLPDTVRVIDNRCFKNCRDLASLALPAGLIKMGAECFSGCRALTTAVIPDGITVLEKGTFRDCQKLSAITFSQTLKTIGEACFANCLSLADFLLPDSLTDIGKEAFYGCSTLTTVHFPKNCSSVGTGAFTFAKTLRVADFRNAGFSKEYYESANATWGLSGAVHLLGTDAGLTPANNQILLGSGSISLTHSFAGDKTILWGSANPKIATVKDGVVTPIQGGRTAIYAKADDDTASGLCQVTVTDNGKATLSSLSLSGMILNEPFDPKRYTYTASVGPMTQETTISATAADDGATVTRNGGNLADPVALSVGMAPIVVKVAAEGLVKSYHVAITVNRTTIAFNTENPPLSTLNFGNKKMEARLLAAIGKTTPGFNGPITMAHLMMSGALDLSDCDLTLFDFYAFGAPGGSPLPLLQMFRGVSAIDFSHNTQLPADAVSGSNFSWDTPKSLNFTGCTGFTECPNFASTNLTEILLPEHLTTISNGAFKGCGLLTKITLPKNLTAIGNDAFSQCKSLASLTLPDTVTQIGSSAFTSCTNLTRLPLPAGITSIGEWSFAGSGIRGISLPDGITTLGASSFRECKFLSLLSLPASVTTIGNRILMECSSLKILDLRQTVFTSADTIGWRIPETTTVLYQTGHNQGFASDETHATSGDAPILLSHTIPDDIPLIWGSSDSDVVVVTADGRIIPVCAGTATVYVHSSDLTYSDVCQVTVAPANAPGLSALSATGLSLNQTFVPGRFYYVVDADHYTTEATLKATPEDNTSRLRINGKETSANTESVRISLASGDNYIPVSVTTKENTVTYTVNIRRNRVHETGSSIALANAALTRALAIAAGKGADYKGPFTFPELAAIKGELSLSGLGITDEEMAVMRHLTGVTDLDLSHNPALSPRVLVKETFDWSVAKRLTFTGCSGIHEIRTNAFRQTTNLTEMVLPETVTNIANSAFYGCSDLSSLSLPEGILELGWGCFAGTRLSSVSLPAGITSLGGRIFADCKALSHADLSKVSTQVLTRTNANGNSIVEGLFKNCTALTGMSDIRLPKGITVLPDAFFEGCEGLTTIALPASITTLGEGAFRHCTGLTSADLTGFTDLGEQLFYGCDQLETVTLPDSITAIPSYFFNGCQNLTNVLLPDSITAIGSSAFNECAAITEMILSDKIQSIGRSAFAKCKGLATVRLPAGLTEIASGLFEGCSALTELAVPDGVTSFGYTALQSTGLRFLALPAGAKTFGYNTFAGNPDLAILDMRKTGITKADSRWGIPGTTTALFAAEDAGLSRENLTITVGTSSPLTHTIPDGKVIVWKSSNTNVATVSDKGIVTAVGKGTAYIAVTSEYGSHNDLCCITVTATP